jgi:hypothetical protein
MNSAQNSGVMKVERWIPRKSFPLTRTFAEDSNLEVDVSKRCPLLKNPVKGVRTQPGSMHTTLTPNGFISNVKALEYPLTASIVRM